MYNHYHISTAWHLTFLHILLTGYATMAKNYSLKKGITTFSIMILSTKGLFVTLSITTIYIECHYDVCHYAYCCGASKSLL